MSEKENMKYTHDELAARLADNGTYIEKEKESRLLKGIPFMEDNKGLDPRVKQFLEEVNPTLRRPLETKDLDEIRAQENVDNKDMSDNIKVETEYLHLENRTLKLRVYNRTKTVKPALIYYHGGGFFERDEDVIENLCKFLADASNTVVIAVEYRLAPEHPYQDGMDDCLETVRYAYTFSDRFYINPDQIGLVGDSVGGNLALGVHHLSREEEWNIRFIGLFCPLVDLSDTSRNAWDINHYDLSEDRELIRRELITMKESLYFIQNLYLEHLEDVYMPLVSPLLREDKEKLPPMFVITAEFDFLRLQAEQFASQVIENGVSVRHIEYKGMDHAFIRKIGVYPQAYDAVKEFSVYFKEAVLNK